MAKNDLMINDVILSIGKDFRNLNCNSFVNNINRVVIAKALGFATSLTLPDLLFSRDVALELKGNKLCNYVGSNFPKLFNNSDLSISRKAKSEIARQFEVYSSFSLDSKDRMIIPVILPVATLEEREIDPEPAVKNFLNQSCQPYNKTIRDPLDSINLKLYDRYNQIQNHLDNNLQIAIDDNFSANDCLSLNKFDRAVIGNYLTDYFTNKGQKNYPIVFYDFANISQPKYLDDSLKICALNNSNFVNKFGYQLSSHYDPNNKAIILQADSWIKYLGSEIQRSLSIFPSKSSDNYDDNIFTNKDDNLKEFLKYCNINKEYPSILADDGVCPDLIAKDIIKLPTALDTVLHYTANYFINDMIKNGHIKNVKNSQMQIGKILIANNFTKDNFCQDKDDDFDIKVPTFAEKLAFHFLRDTSTIELPALASLILINKIAPQFPKEAKFLFESIVGETLFFCSKGYLSYIANNYYSFFVDVLSKSFNKLSDVDLQDGNQQKLLQNLFNFFVYFGRNVVINSVDNYKLTELDYFISKKYIQSSNSSNNQGLEWYNFYYFSLKISLKSYSNFNNLLLSHDDFRKNIDFPVFLISSLMTLSLISVIRNRCRKEKIIPEESHSNFSWNPAIYGIVKLIIYYDFVTKVIYNLKNARSAVSNSLTTAKNFIDKSLVDCSKSFNDFIFNHNCWQKEDNNRNNSNDSPVLGVELISLDRDILNQFVNSQNIDNQINGVFSVNHFADASNIANFNDRNLAEFSINFVNFTNSARNNPQVAAESDSRRGLTEKHIRKKDREARSNRAKSDRARNNRAKSNRSDTDGLTNRREGDYRSSSFSNRSQNNLNEIEIVIEDSYLQPARADSSLRLAENNDLQPVRVSSSTQYGLPERVQPIEPNSTMIVRGSRRFQFFKEIERSAN